MVKYFGMAIIYRLPKSNSGTAEVPRCRYAGLILNSDTVSSQLLIVTFSKFPMVSLYPICPVQEIIRLFDH